MTMLYTTFRLAKEAGACQISCRKFAKYKGGVKKFGENTPIPLTEVLEVCGLDDALWCFRCTTTPRITERLSRLLAADFAEHVLYIYEKLRPDDNRPRQAIKVVRLYAESKIGAAARVAAGEAAGKAAREAAGEAARVATRKTARKTAMEAAVAAAWAAARAAAGAAAWAAAWAAARAAAGAAARAAAGEAAGKAEIEWQTQRFREVLTDGN